MKIGITTFKNKGGVKAPIKIYIMKDYKYSLIIAFLLSFIAVNFFESGNESMGLFMIIPTSGTILWGYIKNLLEDEQN